ncbi:MAG: dockerin type I domain-containing protein, partial [Euryarchaeota archaeon]|nr:dockerin type I domain-containing protein [Euryarchaeota archaeon]
GDNQITPADAAIALQIAVGSRPFDATADVSGDGRVISLDALMILQGSEGFRSCTGDRDQRTDAEPDRG